MPFDKEEILKEAIKSIEDNDLYFTEDVAAYVSCSRTTLYEFFPAGSDGMDAIKELLNKNKIIKKVELRKKLAKGEKAAEILALYKLIATDSERQALSMQHIDHTTKGDKVSSIDYSKLSTETLKEIVDAESQSK